MTQTFKYRRYPKLERQLGCLFDELIHAQAEAEHPILSQIKKVPVATRQMKIQGQDGFEQEIALKEHAVPFELKREVFEKLDLDALWDALAEIGSQFGRIMMQTFFERLREVTEKTGNVVQGGGKPLDCNHLVELYQKTEIKFSSDGTPELPTLLFHPDMLPRVRVVLGDPDCQRRLAAVLQKKKEQFFAKRASS